MATLAELRDKWFLTFGPGDAPFPPAVRHAGSAVSKYTDGNLVKPLIDGASYMKVWHEEIRKMHGVPGAEVYHAGWLFDPVCTLGRRARPDSDAITVLTEAAAAGVDIKMMVSYHMWGILSAPNGIHCRSLRQLGVESAFVDNRFPYFGSNHPKATCLKNPNGPKAILGSVDICGARWDDAAHRKTSDERDRWFGFLNMGATHDLGVQIEGPAVADIERSFSERWNDSSRLRGLRPISEPKPPITTPPSNPPQQGTHSVQVLHTYGRASRFEAYSWSNVGEFTVWASYTNAIKKATKYIYIEDQYFLPFGSPPLFESDGPARAFDLVWQLAKAIERGVKVAVLVPLKGDVPATWPYQEHQRDLGLKYLEETAIKHHARGGSFVAATLSVVEEVRPGELEDSPVYVHSKLMVVDDEFVLVGSSNVNQRSMTLDTELSIGIVDASNVFARDLRTALWAEHLVRPRETLSDPLAAYDTFRSDAWAGRGRVRLCVPTKANLPCDDHEWRMRTLIDPYRGPTGGLSGRLALAAEVAPMSA